MGRLRLYTSDQILDGARSLVLGEGIAAATIGNIARASGAPPGSIYYRFDSRETLLAELWIRAVERAQRHCIAAVEAASEPTEAVVAGGLSIFDFVLSEPADAQLLVSMRRTDLIRSPLPPPLVERLRALNRPVEHLISRLAGQLFGQLFGQPSAQARELITLAVFDLPYGSVRRHLLAGAAPPAAHRSYVELAVRAVLAAAASRNGDEAGGA